MVKALKIKLTLSKRSYKVNKYDSLILAMLSFIILCSFVFNVHNNSSYIPVLGGVQIPGSCFFKFITGHNCPTCGMTRSFISIGHGNFYGAARYNLGGIFAYLLCISFILFLAAKIWTKGNSKVLAYLWAGIMVQCVITAITILFGWIYFW